MQTPSRCAWLLAAGITACLGQGDINSAIDRADKAMYRAKAAGRSRSELA